MHLLDEGDITQLKLITRRSSSVPLDDTTQSPTASSADPSTSASTPSQKPSTQLSLRKRRAAQRSLSSSGEESGGDSVAVCELESSESAKIEASTNAPCESASKHSSVILEAKAQRRILSDQQNIGDPSSNAVQMPNTAAGISETDIEKILKSETARAPFEFCAENLVFYLAVEGYRQIPDMEIERRARVGRDIYERHIAPNCMEPVNVDNATNRGIRESVREGKFTPELYNSAQYQVGKQGHTEFVNCGFQIFHLLKYDCWPRYIRSGGQAVEELSSETGSGRGSDAAVAGTSGEYDTGNHAGKSDAPPKYCTLLGADSASSTLIALTNQMQSVKQWAGQMAETIPLDKNAIDVVDAQTGSTIDPARQAVDALNNRTLRLMPVVRFPVIFLASTSNSKSPAPQPAKVVMLRARTALTVGKVLRPMMLKYNIEPDDAVVCYSATCDTVPMQTPVNSVQARVLTVMSQQQFHERKQLPKREHHKELNSHGDVAFCELSLDEGKGLKHNAIRSYSSNPREFFKFVRKPSQAKGARGGATDDAQGGPAADLHLHRRHGKSTGGSDRRKSLVGAGQPAYASGSATARPATTSARGNDGHGLSVLESVDAPYCGENNVSDDMPSATPHASPAATSHNASTAQQARLSNQNADQHMQEQHRRCFDMPEFLKKNDTGGCQAIKGANGSTAHVPAIYASAVRSDPSLTPSEGEDACSALAWQKADYV
ncbi:Protein RGS-6 [Aphelenchoides avenae]|nr:Protein RGS-6 [Aphelenchus avenae]